MITGGVVGWIDFRQAGRFERADSVGLIDALLIVVLILELMTPHKVLKDEVGVREFHDHLSRYVRHVADGGEVIVTMRGKRIARLAPVDQHDPLDGLRARGLVSDPGAVWRPGRRREQVQASVSDLVADQRR